MANIKMVHLTTYFFISFIFAIILFKMLMKESNIFLKIYDYPNDRKIHNYRILKIGGIGIIFTSLFVLLLYRLINGEKLFEVSSSELSLIFSTFLLLCGALFDDLIGINAPKKLFFQLIAIFSIVNSGLVFEVFNDNIANFIVTTILFILIINSMNLIDGVDGLSVSLFLVFTFFALLVSSYLHMLDPKYYIVISIFLGSFFAFLSFNFPPAKIFLGDTGSQLLGWLFALFIIHFSSYFDYPSQKLYVLSFISLPFYDVFFVMLKRFYLSSSGLFERIVRIVKPDQNHIHHLVLKSNFTHKDCTLLLVCFYFLLSSISIIPILIERFYLLIFVVVLVLNILFRIFFEYKSNQRS